MIGGRKGKNTALQVRRLLFATRDWGKGKGEELGKVQANSRKNVVGGEKKLVFLGDVLMA